MHSSAMTVITTTTGTQSPPLASHCSCRGTDRGHVGPRCVASAAKQATRPTATTNSNVWVIRNTGPLIGAQRSANLRTKISLRHRHLVDRRLLLRSECKVIETSARAVHIPVGSSAKNIWRVVGRGGVLLVRSEQ